MIELTTSLLMLASAFSAPGAHAQTDQGMAVATGTAPITMGQTVSQTVTLSQTAPSPATTTEAYVRQYYKDTPILAEVARCESTFRQFDEDGDVIKGVVNKGDIGLMQINKYYHAEEAAKLGFDIYTVDGNLGYAKHLYEKYGLDPWSSSEKCWKQPSKISTEIARS